MVTDNANQADDTTAFLRAARSGNLEKVVEYLDTDLDLNTANSNGLNALHLASKDGHVEIVTELLKRGAHVDAATKKGNTALHIASLAGQAEIVNILLQYGSTVNIQSQNGFTPLYMAAQENHDQVVKILLCNGANQSLATEDGFTPLAVAMQQGHDKVVSVLLENDSKGKIRLPALHIAAKKDDCKAADLLLQNDHKPDVTSKSGFTPLHIAAHYGNEEIARLLIKRGADVNYLAKHNISPLHVAAKWGKNNMVRILLENSATIDSKTRDGLTPLHCAARSGHDQVVAMLLENSAPISARTKNGLAPLHMASQGDHVDAARVLLYHRAPVDEVTIDYLTSLHVAAHCGHVRVAKLLLDRKADPNARALNGFTPLHIACKKNRIKVVELLIKHGASIESTTESGLTPLHVASFMGCMNIVIFLLQHEANPDVPTVRGETPLHLAARANQTDIIRILLRNGAKVDARAREQQTPLHVASRLGNVDIVMLLLQHGAAVDTATKDMYTALHIAAKEGQEEVAAILVENNASLKAATKNGFTPLHIAAKYGNINVAKILLQKDVTLDARGKNEITALHMACHYDHPGVANLLLEKGASPRVTSQNGHTPLHVAARKNQMEVASTLLEHGADANAESKAGFTPLHLSAQKGHHDMINLLIEHGADPNHKSKNGLTALHLCAQEDFVRVASILTKHGANVESRTETGYRPIHVAAHFGNPSMVRFLLKQNAEVDVKTNQDYTPLHQAAQQGHAHVASALLDGNASHGARTNDGLTALNIAQKLGYISVMEVLKGLPYHNLAPCNKNWEEKYKVVAPESLQEAGFMSDTDDEGGSDTLINEQPYRYLTADLMKSLRDDSLPIDVTRDDPIHRPVSREDRQEFVQSNNYCSAENFEMQDNGTLGFLVSFLVDARGGTMRGCRHSGVRIVVPPRRAAMPIRVTCRLVKAAKTTNPPPLMEGEALATRIVEMGPVGATFLGPVLIDVPHFASARGKEREIIILRSENGETWKEHDNSLDNDDTLAGTPHDPQMSASYSGRITRIITADFPQYFAIITRIKQEVHVIGSEGGILISSVVDHVQAVFPPGALTKKIKVGLQAHVVPYELTAKLLGNCVAVSPVITIEPRRRKFHKPITLTIPVPQAANKGMINQYGGETPTLRLLCSIAGGTSEAQWEDVTGSTPLTFMNDRVSFTTTVSARFWLMDCRNVGEVPKMATELYRESLFVPFVTNFIIYSKRMDLLEATLRILCMTDGKEGLHTLERQEEFLEIVKSRDVEALDGKDLYIEFSGNLTPVTKSGVQLKFTFKAFRQNRLSFHAKVKDPLLDPVARMLFMREPKVAKGEPSQQPICILNIVLPELLNKDKLRMKSDNENDFEDSNIISQKMDSYASEYEAEGKEKSDRPKAVIASPLSQQKFLAGADPRDRGDAAIIHESFAQKAACPLETVDASYPNKLDAGNDDESPEVIEKKTYEEKLKFWEEIGRRKDGTSVELSESKRKEQAEEEEKEEELPEAASMDQPDDDATISRTSDSVEAENVPDISECSVAEKAHYFEEQIQKELMTPAKTSPKTAADSEPAKKEKEKETDKVPSKMAVEHKEYEERSGKDSNVADRVSLAEMSEKIESEKLIEAEAVNLRTTSSATKYEPLDAKPEELQITNAKTIVSNSNGKVLPAKEREEKPMAPESFSDTRTVDTSSATMIKICADLLTEERKQMSSQRWLDGDDLVTATVDLESARQSSEGIKSQSDLKPLKIDGETQSEVRKEDGIVASKSSFAEESVKRLRYEFESRIGSDTDMERSVVENKELIRSEIEVDAASGLDEKSNAIVENDDLREESLAGNDRSQEISLVPQRDAEIRREVSEKELTEAIAPLPSHEQSKQVTVETVRKEFESRIPKHIGTMKVEKEARAAKVKELAAEKKTSASAVPGVEGGSRKTREDVIVDNPDVKRPESRIPKRVTESSRSALDDAFRHRYESGTQARAEIIEELKGRFETNFEEGRSPFVTKVGESLQRTEKKMHVVIRESREESSKSGVAVSSKILGDDVFGTNSPGSFDVFENKSGTDESGFATVRSTIDHKVSAKTEEKETVSSEITTARGTTVVAIAEREHSEEKESERKESTLIEESAKQRVEERERARTDLQKSLELETSVRLLDGGKTFVAAGSASEETFDSAERGTFKSLEDEHGLLTDETNASSLRGTVAHASFEIPADLTAAKEEHREDETKIPPREELEKTEQSREEDEDKLIKESEARDMAETIIRSIESEIESRSMIAANASTQETEEEEDVHPLEPPAIDAKTERPFDEDSKRESISITEDLTRDEESSPRSQDREGSLPFEYSSTRLLHDRDMTVSPSTASDRTDQMEDSMEGDSNELGDPHKLVTDSADRFKEKEQALSSFVEPNQEVRTMIFSRKESFDELSTRDLSPLAISGARVLEIIEPGDSEKGETEETTRSKTDDDVRRRSVPSQETARPDSSSVKLYTKRDITISPNMDSERTDSIDKSLLNESVNSERDVALESIVDGSDSDNAFLMSPKTKVQSLEIKPVNWMIGDEKIEISESLQPSQVFNQELEEYESVVRQMSMEEPVIDDEAKPAVREEERQSSPDDREVNTVTVTVASPIQQEVPKTKFTVIPVSDKQLESELVENNLDISCQELVDTLQKEYDAKTPTDNFISEVPKSDSWTDKDIKSDVAETVPEVSGNQRDVTSEVAKCHLAKMEPEPLATSGDRPADPLQKMETRDAEVFVKTSETEKKAEMVAESIRRKSRTDDVKADLELISGDSIFTKEDHATVEHRRKGEHSKSSYVGVAPTAKAKKEPEATSLDLSARYAITVLDQVVKKEIAEVKESLEAAKQDLIEELSENSETVFQIKDSPSEFQFKLQPEAIPNELPFLYTAPRANSREVEKTDVQTTSSPVVKPRTTRDVSKTETADGLGSKGGKSEVYDYDDDDNARAESKMDSDLKGVPKQRDENPMEEAVVVDEIHDDPTAADFVSVPANRSGTDFETRDLGFLTCPPQPAPRRRHKPSRAAKKIKSDSETDVGSSSGESNYQSCDYETGSGSRPSSSDVEAMQSGMPSGTASEYETALMSIGNSSASRPTSQDYHTAISSLSSRESIKSLYSESSGHLASIESSSELSETLVPSEGDVERDNLDDNVDHVLDDDAAVAFEVPNLSKGSYSPDSENVVGNFESIPSRMKRSSEMIFQHDEGSREYVEIAETAAEGRESSEDVEPDIPMDTRIDNATSTTLADDSEAPHPRDLVRSVDLITSRVDEGGVQSVCTQVTSRDEETDEMQKPTPDLVLSKTGAEAEESADPEQRPDLMSIQQTSMSTSSTSGISLETVVDAKDNQERRSPDSDSFELVDKPDIIDDFVVIEEVGREAEEFDSEGKSIHISNGTVACVVAKNYDREVENLITGSKEGDGTRSASQSTRNNELFDFESEDSPPQVSNEEQLYSQSYSDEEQYEGGKKWVEMQFQTDARGYEIDYDRGPLEDIKEEEITDFEAGSSRFGSLGSHKESVGSVGSIRGSLGSTPEYDVLAGRKYFTKPSEHDNLSLSSLQEFESLESAVAMENARKLHCGSQDSINNGSLPKRYLAGRSGHGDDISLSSLKDFEGLETACREAHMIELRAREEEDLLDHESPENRYKLESLARARAETSAPASFNPSTSGSDDYEKRIREIDEIIRIAQSNVEKFDRQDDTADDISQIEITEADCRGIAAPGQGQHDKENPGGDASTQQASRQMRPKERNVMETSTDSLELDEHDIDKKGGDPLCRSSDSLEMKTTLDLPSLSSDSLNNVRDTRETRPDVDQFDNADRRISSDSLEIVFSEQRENNFLPDKSHDESRADRNYAERSDTDNLPAGSAANRTNISLNNASSNNGT